MECMDTAEEQRVHSPPASLVPRIHVILAQKLQHINPLLPACLNEEESKTCECLGTFQEIWTNTALLRDKMPQPAGFEFKSW